MLFINRKPTHPTYQNVEPAGPGWYRWQRAGLFLPCKWRRCSVPLEYDSNARWLSANKLLDLALDAAAQVRGRQR